MHQSFGFERLAEQVGGLVSARVYDRSQADYRSRMFGEVGTTAIEKLLFYALETFCEYGSVEPEEVLLYRETGEFAKEAQKEPFKGICVEQQVELGGWRVDFVIHRYDWICDKWRQVIVECDGHEFHERTKEQAARDRSRDRRAVLSGVTVLRFTGSEIWRDPLGCAKQVVDWFVWEAIRERSAQVA